MIAAIYARKSTDQAGVSDEERSVARQVAHAREYATRKGWIVDDAHIYTDDGVSGAEFAKRPGFLRLMNALSPRAPFQVLVMSESARLGREAIETAWALKQFAQAGVQVWHYLEDRQHTMESPTDKLLMSVAAFADEMEREKARQRTFDAMQRKARGGLVTGGRPGFGYRSVRIADNSIAWRVDEREAAIVREVFERFAAGEGLTQIVLDLNARGVPAPQPERGRPTGWRISSLRAMLLRERYKGVVVWNKSKKRDRWGQHRQKARDVSEWIRAAVPDLQIVSPALWEAAQRRFRGANANKGRPQGAGVKYLFASLLRCGNCGGSLEVRTSSSSSRGRLAYYACSTFRRCGKTLCANSLRMPLERVHSTLLGRLEALLLNPEVIEATVRSAEARYAAIRAQDNGGQQVKGLQAEQTKLTLELRRLADAIASGADVDAVREGLSQRQARLRDIERELQARAAAAPLPALGPEVRSKLRARLAEWQQLLASDASRGNRFLRDLFPDKVVCTPRKDEDGPFYHFRGEAHAGVILSGFVHSGSEQSHPFVQAPAGNSVHIMSTPAGDATFCARSIMVIDGEIRRAA